MKISRFLGDPATKNLPCNAGNVGLTPNWATKISHAVEQLSLCTKTTETHAF